MRDSSNTAARVWLVAFLGALSVVALTGPARPADDPPTPATTAVSHVAGDTGDGRPGTTFDGPLVRRRAAIAIRPAPGADHQLIGRQLREAARREQVGPLTEATHSVFSAQLLTYLVPDIVVVLPEKASLKDAEVMMKDHPHPGVAFHLEESVLVHDLTFATVPSGDVADAMRAIEREGVLSDSLGRHSVERQGAWLVVKYFGALLSDGRVQAVRDSIARGARAAPERVFIEPASAGAGVDLSTEPLTPQRGHGHG